MATRSLLLLLFFLVSSLLALNLAIASTSENNHLDIDDDDEDLSFLDDDDATPVSDHEADVGHGGYEDQQQQHEEVEKPPEPEPEPEIDEKDVAVLTGGNFSEFLAGKRHVMVEFYAPWCGHCKALAPKYAEAATVLRGEDVALAKVDATDERELVDKYDVKGFPTVLFFIDGVPVPYTGGRTRDAIVTWIKKKIQPAVQNIATADEAEKILTSEKVLVLGFLDSLVDADSQELLAASKLEDGLSFYQTVCPDVAKLFHIDPMAMRPNLVLVKKEAEKWSYFDGQFTKSAILHFVSTNKLPLVNILTMDSASAIFEDPSKRQILLFGTARDSKKVLPSFEDAARFFKGKRIIYVYIDIDKEEIGKPMLEYFGLTGNGPYVLGFSGIGDARKFKLDGELTVDNIKEFAQHLLEGKLKPFYKSEPVPESNDGDVKIVVGNNFEEIVLDESKDVLLEIYAPWCGHCQALEPIYNKLAKHLHGIDSLIIAKMDGTTNEHPRVKVCCLTYPIT